MRTPTKREKPSSTPKPPTKTRRPAQKTSETKRIMLGMRVALPWREWLDDFAFTQRLRPIDILDAAVVAYAAAKGHPAPPSVR